MAEKRKDRFERIDKALDRIREEVDELADGSRETGKKAADEIREAVDDVENRVRKLRKREE